MQFPAEVTIVSTRGQAVKFYWCCQAGVRSALLSQLTLLPLPKNTPLITILIPNPYIYHPPHLYTDECPHFCHWTVMWLCKTTGNHLKSIVSSQYACLLEHTSRDQAHCYEKLDLPQSDPQSVSPSPTSPTPFLNLGETRSQGHMALPRHWQEL